MPRNISRRKRVYRKKVYRKRKGMAKMIKKVAQRVFNKNVEDKQANYQEDGVQVGQTTSITGVDLLSNLYQGTGQITNLTDGQITQGFSGLQFRGKSLHLSVSLLGQLNSGTSSTRLCVVLDKQATNPTALSLYNPTNTFDDNVLQTDQFYSPYTAIGTRRFKVLYDKVVIMSGNNVNARRLNIRIPLKNTLFQYLPNGSSFSALNKVLRFYWCGFNESGQTAQQPSIQFFSRMIYQDA